MRRDEIAAAWDEAAARAIRDKFAAGLRAQSSGLSAGQRYAFDDVIDPAETRDRLIAMLRWVKRPPERDKKKHYVDAW